MIAMVHNVTGSSWPQGAAAPTSLTPLLEAFIPGFSIISSVFIEYLHIDITRYLWSLVALLALGAGVNYCKDQLLIWFQDYLVSTAEIHYDDETYNYIMLFLSKQPRLSQKATHFIAGTSTNSGMIWDSDGDDDDGGHDKDDELDGDDNDDDSGTQDAIVRVDGDDDNAKPPDQMKALRYTPAYGTHYFTYRGRWLAVSRTREERKSFGWGGQYQEQVHLSCLGRDPAVLKALLRDAQRAYAARDGNRTIIYRAVREPGGSVDGMEWSRCLSRPPRPMSTVVLDQAQKDTILDDMREYLRPATRRWYACRGIPYRRGYLLYGPPGTGKTSLCFAAAGLLRLRIYVVSLNSRALSEEGLAGLFKALPWRCIVLLEDIDAAGLTAKRGAPTSASSDEKAEGEADGSGGETKKDDAASGGKTEENKKISLSGFLNIIDGVASAEGRILVMTTNNIEKIDTAILRPGRVDRMIRFGYATREVIAGLFRAIFASIEAEQQQPTHGEHAKANGAAAALPDHKLNGSLANGVVVNGSAANGKPAELDVKQQPPQHKRTGSASSAVMHLKAQRYHDKSDEEVAAMAERFAEKMPPDEFTPAEIQGYLLQHKYSPDTALEGLEQWMEDRREEKKVQKTGL